MMKHRAFTLIELLVVIAIIAILAAILFPVFAQAREKARQTMCLNNEKQITLGVLQYVQDNEEAFPPGQTYGVPNQMWTTEIQPYVKLGTPKNTAWGTAYVNGIMTCPSSKIPNYQSYTLRADVFPNMYAGGPHAVSMAAIDSPADKVMGYESGCQPVADGMEAMFVTHVWFWMNNNIDWNNMANNHVPDVANAHDCDESGTGINWGWQRCSQFPRYRHSGTSNFMFLDGHVKSIPKGRLDWYQNIYNAQTDANSYG